MQGCFGAPVLAQITGNVSDSHVGYRRQRGALAPPSDGLWEAGQPQCLAQRSRRNNGPTLVCKVQAARHVAPLPILPWPWLCPLALGEGGPRH
ncbi:unnamed protein product [Rangifer tarandus platyrhynchus]|uniref:Uncharacterized protein n=1 Tax=Rangifer tarandus platyrhynchus TaxID=3082113 RepID=A0AC59Z6G9_RANTA